MVVLAFKKSVLFGVKKVHHQVGYLVYQVLVELYLVHDRDKQYLINNAQRGLNEVSRWCKQNKLGGY